MLASAGTFLHTGLKVPYFIWFGKNHCAKETWERAADPPGTCWRHGAHLRSSACSSAATRPYLYKMLPYPVEYEPYTSYHVSETLQVLLFTALGFFLLIKKLGPRRRSASTSTGPTGRAAAASSGWPRQAVQASTTVGELYRLAGLMPLMVSARSRPVRPTDHRRRGRRLGRRVRRAGGRLRGAQRGALQENLTWPSALAAVAGPALRCSRDPLTPARDDDPLLPHHRTCRCSAC
jgi:multicomponent Na+:H+ antiporter subunit D